MRADGDLLQLLYACIDGRSARDRFLARLCTSTDSERAEWWWVPSLDKAERAHLLAVQSNARTPSGSDDDPDFPALDLPEAAENDGEGPAPVFVTGANGDTLNLLARPGVEDKARSLVRLTGCSRACRRSTETLLRDLEPHVARCHQLAARVGTMHANLALSRLALDFIDVGVVLLDAQRQVLLANQRAERVFCDNDGITLRMGNLCASGSAVLDQRLQTALHKITEGATAAAPTRVSRICIDRFSDAPPYVISAWSLAGEESSERTFGPCALVIIADTDTPFTNMTDALQDCFDLSPAEARVAELIAQGHKGENIANRLNLRQSTVRQYTKSILAKTGTNRQAQLVRILTIAFGVAWS